MKKSFLLLLLALMTLPVLAQQQVHSHRRAQNSWRNDYHSLNNRKDGVSSVMSLRIRRAGELDRQLTPEDRMNVTTLILEGVVNDADLQVIADLGRRRNVISNGKEVKAFLNVDMENVRYFNGDHECDFLPDYAFRDCKTLRSIVLPYRLREIGRSAFSGCSNLQVVAMPDDLDVIGRSAFYDCSSLTSIFIPDFVTVIADETFRGCTDLRQVSLPDGLVTIGDHAFRASGLTSIEIPASVRTIGERAFVNTKITVARIPATVEHCDATAFGSWQLQEYIVEEGNREDGSHEGFDMRHAR